jgi:hypothetical protein
LVATAAAVLFYGPTQANVAIIGPVMTPTSSNTPEESIAWEATTSYELVIDWKGLANGGRKIDRVGFKLNTKLPKVALDQFVLMINLRDAALRCVWPLSRSQARWGGRSIIAMAHGLAPHMSWMEPGGSALLGVLAREATVAGDLGFMRNLIEDIDALRNWSRTKPDKISDANLRRIEAVNWAFHEIRNGRWFTKAGLAEHLDCAGLGTDAGNLARDIFKLPGIQATPRQPRRR